MKIKQATLYRMDQMKWGLVAFYTAIACSFLLSYLAIRLLVNEQVTIHGIESSSFIFLFVFGLNGFKPYLKMFLQNGISRGTLLISFILSAMAYSLTMTLVDILFTLIFTSQMQYRALFGTLYPPNFIQSLLWTFSAYLTISAAGLLVTVLYYHMNKLAKILFSVFVPLLLFVGLPIAIAVLPQLNLGTLLLNFSNSYLGIDIINNTFRPMTAVLSFLLTSCGLFLVTYPMVRHAVVKEA